MHTIDGRAGCATVYRAGTSRAWLDEAEVPNLGLRLLLSVALTLQLFLVAAVAPADRVRWLELVLASPVVLWAALPVYGRAVASVQRRRPNMFALLSLGVVTAYVYSLVVTVEPAAYVAPHLYFGAAASTVTVILAGEGIERFARRRAMRAIDDDGTVSRMLAPRATHLEDIADRISAALVPTVLAVAAMTFIAWMLIGPAPRLPYALASAVAVLVIASPAAIGLATPMSFLMATLAAKRDGIFLRDAESTERLANVTTLVVDRTGVVTEGRQSVEIVEPAPGVACAELMSLIAEAERESEHPVARAVVAHARAESEVDGEGAPYSVRRPVRGRGVIAEVSGRSVVLGTAALLAGRGVAAPEAALRRADALRYDGATVSFVAVDGAYAGLFAVRDSARGDAREAIAELRRMGVRVILMTGAERASGRHVGRALDLHEAEVFAPILPDERADVIAGLAQRGEVVAVATSDDRHAPAAAAADVAIRLGGSDLETQVSLERGDLFGIVRAIRLARRTAKTVRQNLALAFGYNLLAIPFAAGACYAATRTALSPVIASGAMALGTVSVIVSSLRLLARRR